MAGKIDLVTLSKLFDSMQLTREEISQQMRESTLALHRRFSDLGYEEMESITCEYGDGYKSPMEQLAERGEKLTLPIVIPAEFVPNSRAAEVLSGLKSSKAEVYAVYSQ